MITAQEYHRKRLAAGIAGRLIQFAAGTVMTGLLIACAYAGYWLIQGMPWTMVATDLHYYVPYFISYGAGVFILCCIVRNVSHKVFIAIRDFWMSEEV